MSSTDIKVNDPITSILAFLNAIELKSIDNTFVLWACNFIVKLGLFEAVDPFWFTILYSAAFWIFEEDGGGAILEDTLHEMNFIAFFIAGFFAVKIYTLIQGFVIHPNTVKGLFAVGLSQARFYVHAFTFNKLDFGIYLEDLLFGHDFFFLLDDGWRKRFKRLSCSLAVTCLDGTDPNLVNTSRKQVVTAFGHPIMTIYFHIGLGK